MGIISSHVNITSGWPGHQAKNEAPTNMRLFSGNPSRADHARRATCRWTTEVMVDSRCFWRDRRC
jgi:hypothetical protein